MGAGCVIGMSSTCTPEHVKMLAEKARAKGVEVLDAPICRGQMAADTGTMLILCGGKPEVFERGKPIYSTFGKDYVLLGDIGAGQFGKAMNNFLLWVNGIALIEAGRLAEANGMDLVKLREALLMSSGASDALKNWENVSFLWALKDMQIVRGWPTRPACRCRSPAPSRSWSRTDGRSSSPIRRTGPATAAGRSIETTSWENAMTATLAAVLLGAFCLGLAANRAVADEVIRRIRSC